MGKVIYTKLLTLKVKKKESNYSFVFLHTINDCCVTIKRMTRHIYIAW